MAELGLGWIFGRCVKLRRHGLVVNFGLGAGYLNEWALDIVNWAVIGFIQLGIKRNRKT